MQDDKQAPGMLFAKFSSHISSTSNIIPLPARKKRETRAMGTTGRSRAGGKGWPEAGTSPGSEDPRDWFFLPTDLELCLFHKTPFLGRDAGTGESGFDRLK